MLAEATAQRRHTVVKQIHRMQDRKVSRLVNQALVKNSECAMYLQPYTRSHERSQLPTVYNTDRLSLRG